TIHDKAEADQSVVIVCPRTAALESGQVTEEHRDGDDHDVADDDTSDVRPFRGQCTSRGVGVGRERFSAKTRGKSLGLSRGHPTARSAQGGAPRGIVATRISWSWMQ